MELKNLLGLGLEDVCFIGIWGMGRIGKTTLAWVVYARFQDHFEGCSFLANVGEKAANGGLVTLQRQLLSDLLFERGIDLSDVQRGINIILKRLCQKSFLSFLMMWINLNN